MDKSRGCLGLAKLLFFLLLNVATLFTSSLACPTCSNPPKRPPPYVRPPHIPKPPHVKPPPVPCPPPKPPVVKPPPPPHAPKPPVVKPPPPYVPKPPVATPPPYVPKPPPAVQPPPPYEPKPPVVQPPPPALCPPPPPPSTEVPCPPPPPPAVAKCDTLKLGACVDVLGGLIHIGIGSSAKDKCCPVLQGLLDVDAALCLCTAIRAKLLNISIVIPIALQVLVDCGKTPPPGFQCPAY